MNVKEIDSLELKIFCVIVLGFVVYYREFITTDSIRLTSN